MTPEGKVKHEIKKVLKKHKAYYFMPVQGGYGMPSLDFIGAHRGYAFSIEAKAPKKKPTKRQEMTIEQMEAAGIKVFVIDGDTKELDEWLRFL